MTTNAPTGRPITKVRIGTPALVGVVLALAVPVGVAAAVMTSPGSTHQDNATKSYSGKIDKIVVKGGSGSVDFQTGAAAGTALVETDRQWSGDKTKPPAYSQTFVDGTLALSCVAPDDGCGVSWIIHAPTGVAVTADVLDGSINVTGDTGALALTTTNGSIDGSQLGGSDAVFTSTNGAIDARFSGQPKAIRASSTNGSIDITTNGSSYAVKPLPGKFSISRNGRYNLTNTGATGDASNTIYLGSENGDVSVRDPNS